MFNEQRREEVAQQARYNDEILNNTNISTHNVQLHMHKLQHYIGCHLKIQNSNGSSKYFERKIRSV